MRTGVLLEELINIAKIPKTDFALSMNMTPSGLSKILTGKRLPLLKEKRIFSRQAASYFSEVIYDYGCYLRFETLFPVVYDFSSKYELELFLATAIKYSLDKDFAAENRENVDYFDMERSFLGKKSVLNMVCVILSDYLLNDDNIPLEFYSTIPVFSQLYSDIFQRIRMIGSKKPKNVSMNHFFDMSFFEAFYSKYNIDLFLTISKAQQHFDLNLWKTEEKITSTFLLLKGRLLLLFNIQIDGTPLMTFVTHKGYITAFFNSLMKKNVKKISYNRNEAIAALEANPSCMDQFFNNPIDAVYNFISIGYLIEKKELDEAEGSEVIKELVMKFFNHILTTETTFFVTIDAMTGFCATGNAIVPLLGAVNFSPDKRIPYLQRFNLYIGQETPDKIRILNGEPPKMAVLCSQEYSIIYLIDEECKSEKIHYFETDVIHNILSRQVTGDDTKEMDFSTDLWEVYIEELSRNIN
ncbi:hypothetical protein [Faecalicatena contorta]|uniref:Uncharacterized protein n=1 Tax=Faecalicatena contorta TaxID=39482 RepID=A0A315ZS58_9FIRM|nr:hypothetical protein [Faecalicatena contorta]PWJ48391.1 hypothetical protein A8805_11262 [Faecalicatena contorta]SUQ15414.1 hypothetical protein SAMN05216529_11262 [Faecalicatena contorta]